MSLTAIIPVKPGAEDKIARALADVGAYVAANEPGTLSYRVIRADGAAPVFVTHEVFRDRAAMAAHNDGAGSKAFFAAAEGLLGDVTVLIGAVFSATPPEG